MIDLPPGGRTRFWSRKSMSIMFCLPCKRKKFRYPLSQLSSMIGPTSLIRNGIWDTDEKLKVFCCCAGSRAKCNSRVLTMVSSMQISLPETKESFTVLELLLILAPLLINPLFYLVCFGSFGHRISIRVKRKLLFWLYFSHQQALLTRFVVRAPRYRNEDLRQPINRTLRVWTVTSQIIQITVQKYPRTSI